MTQSAGKRRDINQVLPMIIGRKPAWEPRPPAPRWCGADITRPGTADDRRRTIPVKPGKRSRVGALRPPTSTPRPWRRWP